MILYFTGTGNSRYIAKRIADALGEPLVSMNEKIQKQDISAVCAEERLVFVTPTYAWRIPRVVEQWIRNTTFTDAKQVWFVMDCGGEIGNAAKYNQKLCDEKRFVYMGTVQIVMPENYIAMFGTPQEAEAKKTVEAAEPVIAQAIQRIANGQEFVPPRDNLYDRFMSGPVNSIFYSLFVKADAFVAGEKCLSCGRCEKLCPMNNIKMQDGKPVWDKNCTHCMACISYCPTEAIEYGKKSKGKPRYRCEE